MYRWKYLIVFVALSSWLAKLLLEYISDAAVWFWYLSLGLRLVLLLLLWFALLRRRWWQLAIFSFTIVITLFPVLGVGDDFVDHIQEKLFRVYILHHIGASPFEGFLSKCKLVDYVENDGSKHTIGQCNDGLRSTEWFLFSVVYDPTNQFTLPGYRRSTVWRLEDNFVAGLGIERLDGKHLIGDFYYLKAYADQF